MEEPKKWSKEWKEANDKKLYDFASDEENDYKFSTWAIVDIYMVADVMYEKAEINFPAGVLFDFIGDGACVSIKTKEGKYVVINCSYVMCFSVVKEFKVGEK